MNIESIKDSYDNQKTYANVRSILKRINLLLDLKPVNYIHAHQYVLEFDDLCSRMISSGFAKTKEDLVIKLSLLIGLIKRLDVSKCIDLRDKLQTLRDGSSINIQTSSSVIPWSEMLEMLEYEIVNNPNTHAKVACVCFKHGYVLRISEIYGTTTGRGRPGLAKNFLDLDNLVWHVTDEKPNSLGIRRFTVTQEFVNELKEYLTFRDYLMIYKSTFEMYTTNLLSTISINSFTMNEVRQSFENFNWSESGRIKEESTYWSTRVLGLTDNTIRKFRLKATQVEPAVLQGCDPHPLYIENPDKYSVNGKIKVIPKLKIAEN
jgi:hypothetical protein